MSYQTSRYGIGLINSSLQARYEQGDPVLASVSGKPYLRIISFAPFVYQEYGFLSDRAPKVAGQLVLRALLSTPHPGSGMQLIAGLESAQGGYGFVLGSDENTIRMLNDVARDLGHDNIRTY